MHKASHKAAEDLREAGEQVKTLSKQLDTCARTAKLHGYALTRTSPKEATERLPFFWDCLLESPEWRQYILLLQDSKRLGWEEGLADLPCRLLSRTPEGQLRSAERQLRSATGWISCQIPMTAVNAILEAMLAGARKVRQAAYRRWAEKASLEARHAAERKQLDRRHKREREAAGPATFPSSS